MAKNRLVKELDLPQEELEKEVQEALRDLDEEEIARLYNESVRNFELDSIVRGKIVNIVNDDAIIDVGYKSEGVVPLDQFENAQNVKEGEEVEVLLEAVEDEEGMVALSKWKADRIRGWERVISTYKEGDVVRGRVTRKIKGGLLLEIGVPVFLPASQIGIRRTGDISEYIGKELECKIIKIDESRMNIVVSRRKLLEEQREEQKRKLLEEIEVGQIRKGVVKNITDFGAFVDLGGIDGLLHITDMSWGRINHPSEVVQIDQEIEVKVLKVDKERERISLGLKQKEESPWANIEQKYPVGSRVKGKVVNVLSYGAFVQLEPGVEGLVHVSEMSWTKRINHPNQVVSVGDEVEVVVLEIKKDKQEISLGMKQTEANPWTQVEEKYPPGTIIEGKVRNLTNYGAFVELEDGIDGLLHVADMSWTRKVVHPSEVLKKGDTVRAVVLQVDQDRKRIALGLKQLEEDPWVRDIPERYPIGRVLVGEVTKITNFGVFVRLEPELEGLLHISELAHHKVSTPEEVVRVGEKIPVKVIKIDPEQRKIGLSLKEVEDYEREAAFAEFEAAQAAQAEAAQETATQETATQETATQETAAQETAAQEVGAAPEAEGAEGGEPPQAAEAEAPETAPAADASEAAGEPGAGAASSASSAGEASPGAEPRESAGDPGAAAEPSPEAPPSSPAAEPHPEAQSAPASAEPAGASGQDEGETAGEPREGESPA